MKLSEAIRLGAMLKPQAFGDLLVDGGTCAVGAACDAMGLSFDHDVDDWPEDCRPVIFADMGCCPICGNDLSEFDTTVGGAIAHLNDDHRWTREQIADWVESIERQQEQEEASRATSSHDVAQL